MNVLHVIPAVAPRYGGPSNAVVGMARALRHAGVSVQIATTDADGPGRLPVDCGGPVTWLGVTTRFYPRQWSESVKYSAPLANWLGSHVQEFDAVHIHAVFSHACVAAARACRAKRVPYVVRPLGTLDPWSMRQKPLRKKLFWHLGVKQMLCDSAAIHYTTASEQRLAEAALGLTRGTVIPLGVDDDLLTGASRTVPSCEPYILSMGRLHPKKGLELLLDAFLDLGHDFQKWRLLIAGDGDPAYVEELKNIVRTRQADDRVTFGGWLGGAAKVAALREASLLALTSYQENFGIVVAEALACGTPVLISAQVNLADEVAGARAGWIVRTEPSAVLQGLVQALGDEDDRRRRGAAGRDLVCARFSWDRVAMQLMGLYSSIGRA